MNFFDPWQDTISLLSGANPHRTPKPGEQFETPELPDRASRTWVRFSLDRVRLWFPPKIGGTSFWKTDSRTSTHAGVE